MEAKANDILAEIDTPEVDQQLAQAKAQLQVAQSAAQLALVTYQRDQTLFEKKVLDAQTRDTAADTYQEDKATIVADQANIDRLNALRYAGYDVLCSWGLYAREQKEAFWNGRAFSRVSSGLV